MTKNISDKMKRLAVGAALTCVLGGGPVAMLLLGVAVATGRG